MLERREAAFNLNPVGIRFSVDFWTAVLEANTTFDISIGYDLQPRYHKENDH